ncbi:pimeloyl-ACP methyl ester carboxylesterase [Cryobacterium mesophilum]|uniref:Alpha/beta hydrolase n=1 Tax=Terrimesophilobacter mesophilus TaxID=433647 RepID=A0A4R8VDA3_9MICO|nr:alpha/beta hydrolase [Terrimesophilobacter mesophilus]MBB5633054.1 pimeloyl-ACP methyl ester carboxylesterase [Terrimesophilobacter mesophilus]TFB79817.1 alpha/beta hydrolase [Terrimesophilobacter mesophilus]
MPARLKSLHVLDQVAPRLAAEIVWRLWRTPRKPRPLTAEATPVMDLAVHAMASIAGRRIATYRWGSGSRVILLVHGWEGRAADFAPIVRELRSRERTILAIDAPGHGDSSGRRTTVIDYAEILAEVARRHGRLEAVVSHSLGTPSVAAATRHGLQADRFVSLGGVADLGRLVPTFCQALGVRPSTVERVRTLIENRVFSGDREVWTRYSAAASPLPASDPLLVIHDRADRVVPFADASLLADTHGPLTRSVVTEGLGHYRILSADAVLDEVSSFLGTPSAVEGSVPAIA